MVGFVRKLKKLLVTGGTVISVVGFGAFAGVAAADPETCYGGVPDATAHMPAYPDHRVPGAQDEGCSTLHDTSNMSVADMGTIGTWGHEDIGEIGTWGYNDIGTAGSFPGNSAAFSVKPQDAT